MRDPNPEQIEAAARALAEAVRVYLAAKPTGQGRKTAQSWGAIVADSFGWKRVNRSVFDRVLATALDMGLLVKRTSEKGRERLFPGPQLLNPDAPSQVLPQTSKTEAGSERKKTPPRSGFPADGKCERCSWAATACAHCDKPAFDDDLYVDSKGRWRCGSCNDLCYTDSWGGFQRWKTESDVNLTNLPPGSDSTADPENEDRRGEPA
jgi:hypothetical protein